MGVKNLISCRHISGMDCDNNRSDWTVKSYEVPSSKRDVRIKVPGGDVGCAIIEDLSARVNEPNCNL